MIKIDYSSYRRQQLEFASTLIRAAEHALTAGDDRYDSLTKAAQDALARTQLERLPVPDGACLN